VRRDLTKSRTGQEAVTVPPAPAEHSRDISAVPPGLPPWVTADFIDETIRVWQPHSSAPLTPADAIEIIMNTSHLLDVVLEEGAA
jgi:hypothetical protein